ncbi:MAG: helix-turn-helix domain-containing protein [Cellulosilyticaceae bacterium]
MDSMKIGRLILQRRKEKGMTQLQLAEQLGVSDKAVSKWERGLGCPDIAYIKSLAEILEVNVTEVLSGEIMENDNMGGNMKKIKFYACPVCGNVITGTNEMILNCCGKKLEPLEVQKQGVEAHKAQVELIEDEVYVTFEHEMTKEHYISFVAYVTFDKLILMKLYPEQNAEVRFFKRGRGMLYTFCSQEGLFVERI